MAILHHSKCQPILLLMFGIILNSLGKDDCLIHWDDLHSSTFPILLLITVPELSGDDVDKKVFNCFQLLNSSLDQMNCDKPLMDKYVSFYDLSRAAKVPNDAVGAMLFTLFNKHISPLSISENSYWMLFDLNFVNHIKCSSRSENMNQAYPYHQLIQLEYIQETSNSAAFSFEGDPRATDKMSVCKTDVSDTICNNNEGNLDFGAEVIINGDGLHQSMNYMWKFTNLNSFVNVSPREDHEFEIMLVQLIPNSAYFDIDELLMRHDFKLMIKPCAYNATDDMPYYATINKLFSDQDMNIEKPAHTSPQHMFGLKSSLLLTSKVLEDLNQNRPFCGEVTIPIHLRYPKPRSSKHQSKFSLIHWLEPMMFCRLNQIDLSENQANSWALCGSTGQGGESMQFPSGEGWNADYVLVVTLLAQLSGLIMLMFMASLT